MKKVYFFHTLTGLKITFCDILLSCSMDIVSNAVFL